MPIPPPDRRELRERRRAKAPAARMQAAEAVAERLLALANAPQTGYVAGYWAMDGELPLHVWQLGLPKALIYCLPVLDEATQTLKFAPWRSGDGLVSNRFGIPEPDLDPASLLDARQMALVALPLTGFDTRAHRLGMGGGWYDRTLAFRRQSAAAPLMIGIGFDVQQVEAIEPHAWDVACDAIVTETRTILRAA